MVYTSGTMAHGDIASSSKVKGNGTANCAIQERAKRFGNGVFPYSMGFGSGLIT